MYITAAVEKTWHTACTLCAPICRIRTARSPEVPHVGFAAIQDDSGFQMRAREAAISTLARNLLFAGSFDAVCEQQIPHGFAAADKRLF